MKFARPLGATAALCALVAAALTFTRLPAHGFDLKDSPATIAHPATDITDTYLFPSPTNPGNVVAVMDVYPSIPAGAGKTTFFGQSVLYQLKFDTKYKEEAVGSRPTEDVVIQIATSAVSGSTGNQTQQISVYGPAAPNRVGPVTKLVSSTPTGMGFINRAFSIDDGQVTIFAGTRRDPQFFDKSQFYSIFPASTTGPGSSCLSSSCPSGFAASGTDYFANSNVLSIVVEMPRSLLLNIGGGAGDGVAYWATTSTTSGS